jgi:chitin synthase
MEKQTNFRLQMIQRESLVLTKLPIEYLDSCTLKATTINLFSCCIRIYMIFADYSGESGSGKSVSRGNFLRALLQLNGTLAEQCKQAQILLSPFITSKTITSPVSSRMGTQISVQYATTDDTLAPIGVKFNGYRLEQSRVSHVPPGERNFHVFYHLSTGTSSAERDHIELKASTRYRYLGHPSQKHIKEISDQEGFTTMKMAFKKLGFGKSDAASVCHVLAAILHLGQLEFTEKKTDSIDYCTVKNRDVLDTVAAFLGVLPNSLEVMLAHKGRWVRKERVTLMLDPAGCLGHVDELARTLYKLLVDWIIDSINDKLNREGEAQKHVHVVDFPGFQYVSSTGPLEQLLANVANEHLYNIYVNTIFKRNMDLYKAEQISFAPISFFDPAETLASLAKRNTGLLAILDNQSSKNKTDANLLTVLEKRFENSDSLKPDRGRGTFMVNHYAGGIEYSTQNLMSANEESGNSVASDFLMVFAGQTGDESYTPPTSNGFVLKLFEKVASPLASTARLARQQSLRRTHSVRATKPKMVTAAAAGGNALANLAETIESGRSELVLHIKSNDRRMKGRFDRDTVKMQVEAFSLPDAIKRIIAGEHSHHIPFAEFLSRYGSGEVVGTEDQERDVAEQIVDGKLKNQGWSGRDVVLGVTGVFLSDSAFEVLESQRLGLTSRPKIVSKPSQLSLDGHGDSTDVMKNTFGNSESKLNLLDNAQTPDATSQPGSTGKRPNARPSTMFSEWGGVVSGGDMFSALPSQSHMTAQAMEKGFLSEVVDEVPISSSRKKWMFLVWLLTWYIPDFALRLLGPKKFKRKDVRTAWREKLAINYLIWLACAASIFVIAFFGNIICPKQNVFT